MYPSRRIFLLGSASVLASCANGSNKAIVAPIIDNKAPPLDDSELLDDLQKRTFNFFWETTNPNTGLTPDRWPTLTFSSVASIGFALTAYCIGVERKFVTRQEAATRTLNTLRYLWNLPQGDAPTGVAGHKGFFYHFLNYSDGTRFKNCELSSIDTTLMLFGAITASQYFNGAGDEAEIRDLARKLFERVDWGFLTRPSGLLGMGWHPETGFIKSEWEGYSEGIICYLLAFASPSFPMDPSIWEKYCSTYDNTWDKNGGTQEHVGYFSLMVHQIPHIWYDLKNIQDPYMKRRGLDYFENARRATLTQRHYATQNPMNFKDYGENMWGFAACDGPIDAKVTIDGILRTFRTYSERGPGTRASFDDGTIAPTGALSSFYLTPRESMLVLKELRQRYGEDLYGQYGFFDSFNPTYRGNLPSTEGVQKPKTGWVSKDYLGIDQGPILAMIENYRTGMIVNMMRDNPIIKSGLKLAGFKGGYLDN